MSLATIRGVLTALLLLAACGKVNGPGDDSGGDGGGDGDGDGDGDDTTPPTVTASEPGAFAAGLSGDIEITATFSEAMDPGSLTAATFRVAAAGTPVEGTVAYDGLTATFTPVDPLALGTPFTASITPAASDLAGNELVEPYEWSFTTRTTTCVKVGGGDGCQTTIAAAIADVAAGDSIAVAAGTYTENLSIDRTITLLGGFNEAFDQRDPASLTSTITPADPVDPIVRIAGVFDDSTAVAPIFDGFTLTGAQANDHGGAFNVFSSDVQLRNNVLIDNQAFFLGGAVWIQYGAPRLVGNRIEGNTVGGQDGCIGGGVVLEATIGAALIDNLIVDNDVPVDAGGGGGVWISGGSGTELVDNRIEGNRAGGINLTASGAGIGMYGAEVRITGGSITDNDIVSRGPGGGLYANSSRVHLEGVVIASNGAGPMEGTGSGVAVEATTLIMTSSLVAENRNGQAGVWVGPTGAAGLINCTIVENPGHGVRTESPLTLTNSILLGHTVGVRAAAVEPVIIALSNDFFGNTMDVAGFALGESNVLVDPQLDDTLHLTASSPLLDVGAPGSFEQAGTGTRIDLPAIDVDGEPRVMVGPSDASRVDVGADERAGDLN